MTKKFLNVAAARDFEGRNADVGIVTFDKDVDLPTPLMPMKTMVKGSPVLRASNAFIP